LCCFTMSHAILVFCYHAYMFMLLTLNIMCTLVARCIDIREVGE
jgi:hypothetical protein